MKIKELIALLVVAVFSMLPSLADEVGAAAQTWKTLSVTSSNTEVDLNSTSTFITVVNTSDTDTLYMSPVSPATTSSGPILPHAALSYSGKAMNKFWLISGGSTITAGVIAH